jgi:hypothetical protein
VSIRIIGEDLVNLTESDLMLTIQLEVTGYSFGIVPLQILPVSYAEFDDVGEMFGVRATLGEIVGSRSVPVEQAVPCERLVNAQYCIAS